MGLKEILELALGVVFIVVGGLGFGWFKILKETNVLLRDQNDELKKDNKEWQAKHIENEKAIVGLQAQINAIKDIPLRDISHSLSDVSKTQKEIVQLLKQAKA